MKHMRNKRTSGISISGSRHKQLLKWDGYYHGYKGYRFYRESNKRIPYKTYDEVHAVIEYDMELKAAFYPQIMFLETSLKNMSLEVLLEVAGSNRFNEIYTKLIHKSAASSLSHQLRQRDNVYSILTKAYEHSPMIQHFYNKDDFVPIWAIFEILPLGDFGNLVSALAPECREKLSVCLGLRQSCDTDHKLFQKFILTIKDLRNAIAHNSVIFDCRFNNSENASKTGRAVSNCLGIETNIRTVSLTGIYDYAVLVVYLLHRLGVSKKVITSFIHSIEACKANLENKVGRDISSHIIPTDSNLVLDKIYSIR